MTWLRALVAGGLSVLLPGAGHALLRDWFRALVFTGLYLSAVALFFPEPQQVMAAESLADSVEMVSDETEMMGQFVLSFIILFAAIDATFRSLGFPPNGSGTADGPTCPECGKEIDEELDFCHWCTARLEPGGDEPEEITPKSE